MHHHHCYAYHNHLCYCHHHIWLCWHQSGVENPWHMDCPSWYYQWWRCLWWWWQRGSNQDHHHFHPHPHSHHCSYLYQCISFGIASTAGFASGTTDLVDANDNANANWEIVALYGGQMMTKTTMCHWHTPPTETMQSGQHVMAMPWQL